MKRYYLCDIIGDGTEFNPFRPAVADYDVPWAGMIKSDPVTGVPLQPFALVIVGGNKHVDILRDARVTPMPDFPLDAKVSGMHKPTKDAMIIAMQKRGIPIEFLSTVDGYREVIRTVGRQLEPAFDENGFDVADNI